MISRGQLINDRYEIIRSIGEGGMANVYLAQDTILDRKVAVKILRGDLAEDEKFVRRFQREAISASSLNDPNIVEVYDVGEDNGKYFIEIMYNYAKIEVIVEYRDINVTVANSLSVLSSISFNDSVLKTLLDEETSQFKEFEFNIFETSSTESEYLQAVEGDIYEEEEIHDSDLIN